jgi:hypothetical protein
MRKTSALLALFTSITIILFPVHLLKPISSVNGRTILTRRETYKKYSFSVLLIRKNLSYEETLKMGWQELLMMAE